MRSVSVWTALACVACAVPASDVQPAVSVEAIDYAAETEVAVDHALATGRSVGVNAEAAHQEAIAALRERSDAAERIVARAEQHDATARMPYLLLLARVGLESNVPREFLTRLALTPVPAREPAGSGVAEQNHDERTGVERTLGEAFAAASALVARRDLAALQDIYANADVSVAAVAAANASRAGLLDSASIQTLNARGITGSFQPLSRDILSLPDATLGPSAVQQPMEGPQ